MKRKGKKLISVLLALLMAVTGIIPAASAFAGDGVEGYWDIELFYKDTDTMVPSYVDETAEEKQVYVETMKEGEKLNLTYKLIDTEMPDNGYIKWYSDMPTLVDVDQNGVVKAFDSSKGAVIQNWIDNEVKPIPLVGKVMATVLEKALFNDKIDIDSMDTEAIIDIVEAAFGSDSPIAGWIDSYKGELIDSLRKYLNNINSVIHVALYDKNGTELDNDSLRINVVKNDEWYAAFLPNGTHITNKSQVPTTVAVGSKVQLSAITTPLRLHYGTMYSVKSSSIFTQGKVVATVNDSGLVTFKNKGKVTIMASPDTDDIINGILGLVNKFYEVKGTIDSDKLAGILIDYIGIDINRAVLAAILDACFAIKDIVGDTADPVQLTATAIKLISNLVLQFVYNDSITFEVVDSKPLESFDIDGANTVQEGSQIQLAITNVKPSTGDTSDITWTSSNPEIASVDPVTGTITGRDAGGSLGSISTQKCTITATSAANGISREIQLTVTGKTGKYLSDVEITGKNYLEAGQETDLTYQVFPKRVAESNNLYVTWGMVTGEDENGETTYSWATDDAPATDGRGQIDKTGHYTVVSGGKSTVVLKAQTGYYVSNSKFYEISSKTATFEMTNGIPVENITISVDNALGVASSINKTTDVTVGDKTYKYVSVKAGTQYAGLGAQLSATVEPENASNKDLTWVVDNSHYSTDLSNETHTAKITQKAAHENADSFNVYAVSADGKIKSNEITVTVAKNTTSSNKIDKDSYSVTRGETVDATHTMKFSGFDGTYSACYKCNWYSSDENIFTVETKNNENGDATIKGVDVGTATLYCVSYDGGIYGECHVSSDGDRTALKAAIEEYKDIDYKDYAYDYGQVFKAAYDAATDALTDDTLTQEKIDEITQNLVAAYEAMIEHPYVHVTDAKITYQTAAKPLVGGYKDAENGIIGDNNSISINLSGDKYTNYNNYNKITLTSTALPEGAMYQAVEWSVVESYKMDSSISDSSITLTPSGRSNGGWAKVKISYTDEYGRAFEKTINVTMSDKIATGFDIKESELTYYATDDVTQLEYTLSGSPEFGNITWTSSNENAVKVSNDGKLTFVEKGEAVITGTTFDGGFTDKVKVTVLTDFSTLAKKQSEYNALIEEVKDSYTYTKASLDVLSAAVAEAKTMINEGKATQAEADAMLKKLNDAYDSLIPYVASEGVEIGYYEAEGVTNPNPGYFRYTGTFINGKSISLVANEQPKDSVYKSVEWSSSNSNVTVSESGVVTNNSASAQAADITCTITNEKDESYSSTVTVTFVRYGVTGISFADEKVFGAPAQTVTLSPKFELGGNISVIKDCKYVSDNKDIATVDENGVVTFITQGCATITVTAKDGGYTATIKAYTTWDTAALKAAIDEASKINPTDYEVSYANTFTAALDKANEVYANMQAPQSEIDAACDALVAATTALEGHEFIVPEINVKNGDTVIGETALIQVPEDTQKATLSLALNDGAMVKSTDIAVSDENGVKASVSGNDINITKTADKGTFNLTVKVVDEWGREYTKAYAISVINVVIPVTSLELTVDGNVVTDGKYTVSSGSKLTFNKFKGVTVGYIPTPADANAITSVDYKVDDTANFSIDKNGKITLTTIGNLNPLSSIATKVTVTVTNADGSTAVSEFTFTVTKA